MCSPDVPDTSAAQMASIDAQEGISQEQLALQRQQFEYLKNRQAGVDQTTEEVVRRQLAMSEETAAQGRDLYNYQKDVFRPVEQSLVAESMRESTPEYYEQYASKAMAAQAGANANAQGQMERNLSSMGVNPNSGAFASQQRGLQLANAAGIGSVANESRDRAEALGWAKKAEVAGLGKGLVGAGNASYGLASAANTSAANASNEATQTAASAQGTPAQYGQLGLQAAGNVTSAHNDIYRSKAGAGGGDSGLMAAAGTALGYWASTGFAT